MSFAGNGRRPLRARHAGRTKYNRGLSRRRQRVPSTGWLRACDGRTTMVQNAISLKIKRRSAETGGLFNRESTGTEENLRQGLRDSALRPARLRLGPRGWRLRLAGAVFDCPAFGGA